MNINFEILIPIVIYFILMYVIGAYAARKIRIATKNGGEGSGYLEQFMTGGRDMGGFVLSMTLVATYLSAGSFIGGPGAAYKNGLAWIFLAMSQMPTGYYTLMVLGKKFAVVARKIGSHSISDFLMKRYESKAVMVIASLSIVFFLIAAMSSQLIGAARLLQGATGLSYKTALIFFAITVVVHTAIGGFRGVVLNDTMQGIVMSISTLALFIAVIVKAGGISAAVQGMKAINSGMISPFGVTEGFMTIPWVSSFWVLVGFAVVGLPAISMRAMSYKDTKSLKRGIKYGTLISILLIFGMHLVGAFGSVLVKDIASGDLVVPTLARMLFHPVIAGVVLSGPLAAVMSTIDSQLLVVVGGIVNDLLVNIIRPDLKQNPNKVEMTTKAVTVVVGIIIVLVALDPPELMVWLNLFATAGQLSTFLWPTVLGLYWKRANKEGAIASMLVGIGSFIVFHYVLKRPLMMHPIVMSLVLSLVAFLVVSRLTKRPSDKVLQLFWGL